jgi:DNA (cytosine-5)-methyltransferase 1
MSELRASLSKIADYPAYLEACWQEHLAPRAKDAPTVISTFAGCGGSSLGYSMAGFRELLAVEWDDNAVATFKLNFPDVPVYHGDIAKLSVEQCLEMAGLEPGQLDVLDGSPPCQGFSTAGKRDFDDDRNQLFREYVRLLRGLRPKVFVMENVSGMVKGKMKLIFADILRELKASGYRVSARLLNAMYFGVPQSRQRMIFVGVREDLGIEPSHPKAETVPVTVRGAWQGVQQTTPAPSLAGKFGDLSMRLSQGQSISDLTGSYGHGNQRLMWAGPSPTIVKTAMFGAPKMIHPIEQRGLSIGEAKRLQSFPDNFDVLGCYEEAWARIGNSVPPLFMRSIARHIRREILAQCDN